MPRTFSSGNLAPKPASPARVRQGPLSLKLLVTPGIARSFGGVKAMRGCMEQAGVQVQFAAMGQWYPFRAGVTRYPKKVLVLSGEKSNLIAAMKELWLRREKQVQHWEAGSSWTFLVPRDQELTVEAEADVGRGTTRARVLVHKIPDSSNKQVSISGNVVALEEAVHLLLPE